MTAGLARELLGRALLAATALAGAPVLAQAPAFPAAFERQALVDWLRRETDMAPERVVAISPSALTGVISRAGGGGSATTIVLRAQALTPEAAARSGVLAWQMTLEVDCLGGKVKAGPTTGFQTRQAGGEGVPLAPADADWRSPYPKTPLASVWRAVCVPGFRSPLGAPAPQVAQTQAPAALESARDVVAHEGPRRPGLVAPRTAAVPPGAAAAQVISSPNTAETSARLARLRLRHPQAMTALGTRIRPAQVNGRTVYRGLVVGFASRREAAAFCATLIAAGQACLPR